MRACAVVALGLVAGSLAAGMAWGQVATRTVVLAGDPAPGTADSFTDVPQWSSTAFQSPVINAEGDVAFGAYLVQGLTRFGTGGIWATQTGVLRNVVKSGDVIGDSGGHAFNTDWWDFKDYPTLAISDAGLVAHAGHVTDAIRPNSYQEIVWTETATGIKTLAFSGLPAPGLPGRTFGYLLSKAFNPAVAINSAGTVVFQALLDDGVDPLARGSLWKYSAETIELVASALGDLPPGSDLPWSFPSSYSLLRLPAINRHGDVAFTADMIDSDGLRCCSGIWQSVAGDMRLVAMAGDPAPGTANDAVFEYFNAIKLNDLGQLAFSAGTNALEIGLSSGIWTLGDGAIVPLVLRDGTLSVDDSDFRVMRLGSWDFNALGEIAFIAELGDFGDTDSTFETIWYSEADSSTLIARAGENAPGANGAPFSRFNDLQMNARGDVAFTARLGDGRLGLWVYDAAREWLKHVAVEGESFDRGSSADPQVARISSLDWSLYWGYFFSNRVVAGCRGLNDRGELVYVLPFDAETQTAGVFISTLPDPCFADIAGVADCFSGERDGAIDLSDFSCYLARWAEADTRADITVTNECLPGLGGDGVDLSDFSCYFAEWARGCP